MNTDLTTRRLTVGEQLTRNDFYYVTAAQAGTERSLRDVGTDPQLGAVTVVETLGRRVAVCTDTHRLHAVTVTGRPKVGVYSVAGGSYEYDHRLTSDEWLDTVRQMLDRLQAPANPHPVTVRIGQNHCDDLLDIIAKHPWSVVAFRTQSITVHDPDTDELLARIPRAKGVTDRLRTHKLVTIRASVLHRPLQERMTVFEGQSNMRPLIGHRRTRFAVLMPTRPSVGVSMLYDSTGQPIGRNAGDGEDNMSSAGEAEEE